MIRSDFVSSIDDLLTCQYTAHRHSNHYHHLFSLLRTYLVIINNENIKLIKCVLFESFKPALSVFGVSVFKLIMNIFLFDPFVVGAFAFVRLNAAL